MSSRGALRFLRSRKLAIWLLVAVSAYAAAAVSVPGVRGAGFSSPIFLAGTALLGLSTAACAWERTVRAIRLMREPEGVPDSVRRSLERQPVTAVVEGDVAGARTAVRAQLETLGLKTRATEEVVRGRASRFGPLGSPVFHWSLVALFLVIPLGRLSRSEGMAGIPEGTAGVANEPSAYVRLSRGPLYPDAFRDAAFSVTEIEERTRPDGLELGMVPSVRLVRAGRTLAETQVYRNHPLRYGSLMVHSEAWGYYGVFAITGEDGQRLGETTAYFDLVENSSSLTPATVELSSESGARVPVKVMPITQASEGTGTVERRRANLAWTTASGEQTTAVIALGRKQNVEGVELSFEEAGRYARLSIVDDWSVYPMYALLCIAILGLAVAILAPRRSAWVLLQQYGAGVAIRMIAVHDRRDPVFSIMIADVLAEIDTARKGDVVDI